MKKILSAFLCLIMLCLAFGYVDIALSATVQSTHPYNGDSGVPTYQPISVKLDAPVDPDTVNFDLRQRK